MSAAHWGRKWGACVQHRLDCILGAPKLGEAKEGKPTHPSPPLRSRPPAPRTLARVRSGAAVEGVETQRPREREARSGEGASGSAGSAPHSRRKGRGGGGRRAASLTRQRARRGRSARDRVAPSGSERARRQRGHVRGPSSCALPPPRAALSIHKFSACSAATGHRSPPGTPRSRPPARPPWAARPGAEVGAAGPGIRRGGRGQAGGPCGSRSPPAPGPDLAPDHRPFPRGGETGGRGWEWGAGAGVGEATCIPRRGLERNIPPPTPSPGLSFPCEIQRG